MGTVDIPITVPSWNAAYRIRQGGGMYKTEDAKAFQEAVGYAYKGDLHEGDNLEVFIEFGRHRLIDCDNACKLVGDALEGIAYHNDKQVRRYVIERVKCVKGEDWLYVAVNEI
jgi:Holliday junction resolvase RusA-like endonuclease